MNVPMYVSIIQIWNMKTQNFKLVEKNIDILIKNDIGFPI